jgi:uncharacterized protein (TIGR03086 family)
MGTTGLPDLFRHSIDRCTALIGAVGPEQWSGATPCDAWDVRALTNHLLGEQLWAPHLVAGETIEEVGDRYDGDLLGDDPVAAWREAAPRSVAAFAEPGALDRTVHLSYGDESCSEYLVQMLTDAAVHGWDLARATGGEERIDPETASLLLDYWTAREDMVRGSGVFGEAVAVEAGADPQARLLALLGRRA